MGCISQDRVFYDDKLINKMEVTETTLSKYLRKEKVKMRQLLNHDRESMYVSNFVTVVLFFMLY